MKSTGNAVATMVDPRNHENDEDEDEDEDEPGRPASNQSDSSPFQQTSYAFLMILLCVYAQQQEAEQIQQVAMAIMAYWLL
jgi:hypothetical protein